VALASTKANALARFGDRVTFVHALLLAHPRELDELADRARRRASAPTSA
jgi:hypothetical protein